jgi:hypothetical protein
MASYSETPIFHFLITANLTNHHEKASSFQAARSCLSVAKQETPFGTDNVSVRRLAAAFSRKASPSYAGGLSPLVDRGEKLPAE